MKKFLSIVLAAAMVMAMSVTAFAGTQQFDALPGSQDIDVFIRLDTDGDGIPDLKDDTPLGESICIDLTWPDKVEFIYSMSWDPDAAKFDDGAWQESEYDITITNRSTVGVTAVLSYTDLGTGYGLVFAAPTETLKNATFDGATNTVVLANPITLAADENGVYPLPSAVITVTPDANKAVPEADSTSKVGTITVTLSVTPAEEPEKPSITFVESTDIQLDGNLSWTSFACDTEDPSVLRLNYDIGSSNEFYLLLPMTAYGSYALTDVEGEYLDGNTCNLSFDGTTITNNGAAGTYYVKATLTYTPPEGEGEPENSYAYLLIKQDAATT